MDQILFDLTGSEVGATISLCFRHSRRVHLVSWSLPAVSSLLEDVNHDTIHDHSIFPLGAPVSLGAITTLEHPMTNQHEFRTFSVADTISLFGPSALPLPTTALVPESRRYPLTGLFKPT